MVTRQQLNAAGPVAAGATVNMGSAGTANPTGVAVLVPSNGMLTGTKQILDASATNATQVGFALFGGKYGYSGYALGTAGITYYGWISECDTTTIPNNTYALVAIAENANGITVSPAVNVTVSNDNQAAFPSRLHVANHQLLDANNFNIGTLKGFNALAANPNGIFNWAQQDYDDMYTLGARICRLFFFWSVVETSPGVFNSAALASYDKAIELAGNAGMYTVLSTTNILPNQQPGWVVPTGGGTFADYVAYGQAMTEMIATRYANNPYVIGLYPNEPAISASVNLDTLMSGYGTIVGWYGGIATEWPIWVNITGFGNGTPYPTGNPHADPAIINTLDVNKKGIILEWHDYYNGFPGSYSPDGYVQGGTFSGDIAPIQQGVGTFTAEYHGWGGDYNYPGGGSSRAASQAAFGVHIADMMSLRDAGSNFVLAVGEFGIDVDGSGNQQSGQADFYTDKAACYATAGAVVQMIWVYSESISGDPFAARPNGTWRTGIQNWI